MYAQELINYEIDGKKVCLDNKGLDTKKFLTKDQFVKHVINSNSQNINYTNFNNLFKLIDNIQYINMLKNFFDNFKYHQY